MNQKGKFYPNTFGYDITFVLGVDITGFSSIVLFITNPTGSSFKRTLGGGAVVSASTGTFKYTVQDGDLPVRGTYRAVIEVISSGKKLTTETLFSIGTTDK